MNLENLNLVELNAQQKREIEGGRPIGWLGVVYVIGDFLFDVHDEFVKIYKPH